MKIIFLNAWDGTMREDLAQFLKEHARDTDIFCLQEAPDAADLLWKNIFANYTEIAARKFHNEEGDFSQATYIDKDLDILSTEILFEERVDCGLGIYTCVRVKGKCIYVGNFHGVSKPIEKLDNPGRLIQSHTLIEFLKQKEGLKIIGGDFNLLPETKSVEMFEEQGYENLIKNFDIKTTRNHLVWDRFPDNKMYHSDYVFVGANVDVKEFSVVDNEVSDHLPLILEIKI